MYALLLLVILVVINMTGAKPRDTVMDVEYSSLIKLIKEDKIDKVMIQGNQLVARLADSQIPVSEFGSRYDLVATLPSTERFYQDVNALYADRLGVEKERVTSADYAFSVWVRPVEGTPWWMEWLPLLVSILLFGFLWVFLMRQQAGAGKGGVMNFGRSRARLTDPGAGKVTFKDVAGADEEKEELREIVEFLKNPKRFTDVGARIPKGVLLVGPPGTGKTLLARAVSGEAGVPFFTISGSDFVEMFVGVGASRVRDLFEQAKKASPAIVFIDEIDAVGRKRGAGLGGGHDEREQTLNQLLVEMDGFESNEGVILIAATNRPDVLDPALLRPGRFDRQVVVPTPDVKGRLKILEVHTRRTPLDKHVNLEVIARGTPGFSGAALENLVNEAALQAARLGQDTVFMRDFEYAKDKVLMGKERRSLILSDEEKRITAYHEGGHALVAKLLPGTDPVHKVTIIPRGRALGVTMQLPEGDRHGYSKAFLQNNLMVLLAGRVAEEIIFDTITTGAGNDIERATGMARKMVCEWGMSDVVGPMTIGEQGEEVFIGRDWGHARNYSEDTARIVDAEIKKLVETARENCHKLLQENINLLHALAKALLDRETITGDDIDLLVKGEPLPPFDADGSAAKQEPAAPAPASADAGGETFKLEAEPSQDGGTGEKTQDETKQQ